MKRIAAAVVAAGLLTCTALTPVPSDHGRAVVFDAPFSDASNWTAGRTSAYPPPNALGSQCNTANGKLDCISPNWSAPDGDTFTAHKTHDGRWDADEVTTQYSPRHFQLRTGDEVRARVTLHADSGAWAALWTWPAEVDLFEYHAVHPDELELYNHANPAGYSGKGSSCWCGHLIRPGKAFNLQVRLLPTGIEWLIDGRAAFTSSALPPTWRAYLIVNLSIDSGQRAPAAHATTASFTLAGLEVLRQT